MLERAFCRALSKPVGMFFIVPVTFLSHLSIVEPDFSRSFDAGQCVSSEGFLATFTPGIRCGEVKLCYSFPLGIIQIRPPSSRSTTEKRKKIEYFFARNTSYFASSPALREVSSNLLSPLRLAGSLLMDSNRGKIRIRLMTSALFSQGILVASKPTDEDRIGTGRNTHEENDSNSN